VAYTDLREWITKLDKAGELRRALAPYFESIEQLPPFAFGRSGMKEVDLQIFYARVLTKPLPSPYEKRAD